MRLAITTDVPGLDATVTRYPTCTAGGAVELWTIYGGSHEPTFSSEFSALRLLSATPSGPNVTVTWQSAAGVTCILERSTDLWALPPFTPLAVGIAGQAGTTTYTDTNAAALAPLFYRVGVP